MESLCGAQGRPVQWRGVEPAHGPATCPRTNLSHRTPGVSDHGPWEYDDMAAFERAIGFLSKNPAFPRFVAARDLLLAGEESRFHGWALRAAGPSLPEPAPFVVHEVHRVPVARKEAYLAYMIKHGIGVLKANGFRPAGPWVVDVGRWSEVTYLFRFDSLTEREPLIAKFSATVEARAFDAKVGEFVEEITTRLLIPRPFAPKPPARKTAAKPLTTEVLPHREQIAPGVHVAGFADRYRSANCGWVELAAETLLIDLPRGIPVLDFLALVAATTGKPARTLVLTNIQNGDASIVQALIEKGVTRVLTSPATRTRLLATPGVAAASTLHALSDRTAIGDSAESVEFLPLDQVAAPAGAAVWIRGQAVLFSGPLVVHGPRAALAGSDTAEWVTTLRRLEGLSATRVVPGLGSWGGAELLTRQRRFLAELRRQIGYHICQGRPHEGLRDEVRLPADCFAWTPYGNPSADDIEHVYRELTVPIAPFHGDMPAASDSRPRALVLIGDQPRQARTPRGRAATGLQAAGVISYFTLDVNALSGAGAWRRSNSSWSSATA